ncbi:MAG: hypothetical protein PVJ57_09790 [Phycisphaerae bacterium]|jgi:DNA polymerase-3 subunit epsilon
MSVEGPVGDEFVTQELPEEMLWPDRPDRETLARLPACPAVYLLLAEKKVPVQLATTQDLRRLAIARLLGADAAAPARADLAEITRGVRWRHVHSAFEGRWWYYRLARRLYPKQYRRLISFGPAWFLHVDWSRPIPEIRLTDRIWQNAGEYVGPWLTHDTCQKALDGLWDLFDLCRYPEQVQRAPHGQACAYAEMNRCPAPCTGAAPLSDYVERCRAAWRYASGEVRAWIDEAKVRMKQAAAEQRFEIAGQIKHQLAYSWKWHDRWLPLLHRGEALNFLLAVPVSRRRSWKLFLFRQGWLEEGPIHTDRKLPTAAVDWLRARFAITPEPLDATIRMEQTWLVAHLLKSREGDASLVEPLPTTDVPADLAQRWQEAVAARRAARQAAASTADAALSDDETSAPAATDHAD